MAANLGGYALHVLKGVTFKKFAGELAKAQKISGKSKIFCAYDMARSFVKYGAGYYDYNIFDFAHLSDQQKDTYLTRFRAKKLNMQMNDQGLINLFEHKALFNKLFKDYLGRDFLDLATAEESSIKSFFESHEEFFAKPNDLACGIGMELLKRSDFSSPEDFVQYVTSHNFGLLEEVLHNHPDLAKIYDHALNTMRMITIIGDDGEAHLIYAVQKFGINGRIVDNYGVHGPVDLCTGEFLYPAHYGDTRAHGEITNHPNSNEKIVGFRTPLFREAKEFVLQAARVVPELRYVGWDVAITPNGPAIIEGNPYTAHDFWQLPGQTPGGIGILPVLNEIVPSFKY